VDGSGQRTRVVVVARPTTGRPLAATLSAAGYEVYRTPTVADMSDLLNRVQPHAAVVALDAGWHDVAEIASHFGRGSRPVPVLLVGDPGRYPTVANLPRVPSEVGAEALCEAVCRLVGAR